VILGADPSRLQAAAAADPRLDLGAARACDLWRQPAYISVQTCISFNWQAGPSDGG
jgi:hypothetical protein